MHSQIEADDCNARSRGLSIRTAAIEMFSGDEFSDALREVIHGGSLARTLHLPAGLDRAAILRDLVADHGWREECWRIDTDDSVSRQERTEFLDSPAANRFSHSDCLRQPRKDAYALRGLLSALHSDPVLEAMTDVAGGSRISYMTADIARYRPGHYLRRHDDVYDGRVFGLVFFLHDDWRSSAGTRLIAEKPDGRCAVVEPLPGTLAVMRLADGHHHQVEPNLSADWNRYSIAVHFGVKHAQ